MRPSTKPWRKHIVRMTSQRKQNGRVNYCRLSKPDTLKEDQESLHFFESMASLSFMLGC